ncbi:MAG TPA: nucleotide exchange factor GrpE [Thermoplasmata archaeon]|nr:nucleotide exchange factor GrpE [Thermoplasmata archaeon]
MADDRTEAPPPAGAPPTAPVPAAVPAEPTEDWATRFKYLFADFENYRRRAERERESVTRQSRAAILRELLPILEAVRSAREAVRELPAADPVRRGFDLLDREWSTFLKHEGVEPIARLGQPFRAEEAEAVAEAPPTAESPEGAVVEIVQQGYRFFGGILRPAKVVVARAPAAGPTAPPAPAEAPAPEAKP